MTDNSQDENRSDQEQHSSQPKWNFWPLICFVVVRIGGGLKWMADVLNYVSPAMTGIATAGIVWVAYWQWDALRSTDKATHDLASTALQQAEAAAKQAALMQGQLNIMEIDQRPWLSAKVYIGGPFTYNETGASALFKFAVKNTGKGPATHIFAQAMIFDIQLSPLGSPFIQAQASLCETARGIPRYANGPAGMDYTIFSNEQETMSDAPILKRDDAERLRSKGKILTIPYLLVCIDYSSFGDKKYRTAYLFWIVSNAAGVDFDKAPIRETDLMLRPISSYAN